MNAFLAENPELAEAANEAKLQFMESARVKRVKDTVDGHVDMLKSAQERAARAGAVLDDKVQAKRAEAAAKAADDLEAGSTPG